MTRTNTAVFILLLTVLTSSGVAQTMDAVKELKACARLTDQDARYDCFDDLGERVLRAETSDEMPPQEKVAKPQAQPEPIPEPIPETVAATNVQPLPDDLNESDNIVYGVSVTSCKEGIRGDWYFVLANGQIWKAANKRNPRLNDCNFEATIKKDFLGYKMHIADLDKTIRVRRHQ